MDQGGNSGNVSIDLGYVDNMKSESKMNDTESLCSASFKPISMMKRNKNKKNTTVKNSEIDILRSKY